MKILSPVMRAIPFLALLLLSSPIASASTELELLQDRCSEQERQIRQLEEENSRLKSLVNTAAAGLFSVMLDAALPQARVDAFVDALRLFKIGYSWGGPVSLVVPYDLDGMRDDRSALPGHLVRFSIGLESVADLQADLAQALGQLG